MSRTKSDKRGTTRKVWLKCLRHGEFKASGTGKRETSTGKTECLWEVTVTRLLDKISWKADSKVAQKACLMANLLTIIVGQYSYNHELALSAITFHQHCKRDAETLNKIKELSDAALKP